MLLSFKVSTARSAATTFFFKPATFRPSGSSGSASNSILFCASAESALLTFLRYLPNSRSIAIFSCSGRTLHSGSSGESGSSSSVVLEMTQRYTVSPAWGTPTTCSCLSFSHFAFADKSETSVDLLFLQLLLCNLDALAPSPSSAPNI